jgi:Sigma-70, region 4
VRTFGDPDALAQAIQALPPGQRQAVELLKLRELSLKEASALTGMSIGAFEDRDAPGHRVVATRASRDRRRMKTDELIDRLGRDVTVTSPLPPPGTRTVVWMVWAAMYLVVVTVMMFAVMSSAGVTPTPLYLVQQSVAILTGIMAARAAFLSVTPARVTACGCCRQSGWRRGPWRCCGQACWICRCPGRWE